jgi:hypothetical protein
MLANRSDARDRGEAQFVKTQKPKDVGEKALSECEKGGRVVREKTARLRSVRVAKEAADWMPRRGISPTLEAPSSYSVQSICSTSAARNLQADGSTAAVPCNSQIRLRTYSFCARLCAVAPRCGHTPP